MYTSSAELKKEIKKVDNKINGIKKTIDFNYWLGTITFVISILMACYFMIVGTLYSYYISQKMLEAIIAVWLGVVIILSSYRVYRYVLEVYGEHFGKKKKAVFKTIWHPDLFHSLIGSLLFYFLAVYHESPLLLILQQIFLIPMYYDIILSFLGDGKSDYQEAVKMKDVLEFQLAAVEKMERLKRETNVSVCEV